MRIAALILGILGGLISGAVGFKWWSDAQDVDPKLLEMAKALGGAAGDLDKLIMASYVLMAGALAGIIGGILAMKGNKIGGILMIPFAIIPAFIVPSDKMVAMFVFLAPLLIGGILGLLAKPKVAA